MRASHTGLALALVLALLTTGAGTDATAAERGDDGSHASWSWPVPVPREVVRGYLAPPTPYGIGHRGIDLRVAPGTPVAAVADGVVHFAGPVGGRPLVSVRHDDGTLSSLEPVEPSVEAGARVLRGGILGVVATDEGHCTGCLHLGARTGGEYVSPLLLLGVLRRAVLLPP